MADIIGFDNTEQSVHRMNNTLDGKLELHLYVNKAVGETTVLVNGISYITKDAGDGSEPFDCGILSLPRGEMTIEVTSECEISEIMLAEREDIDTKEKFDLNFANRKGQFVFERKRPDYTLEMLEQLKRHGFLYEEIKDCATGHMPSGIPLGGMGCGKLEICEDGMFTAFTGNNNQDSPIFRMPGTFIALGTKEQVKILRKDTMALPYEPMESVETDFLFPFAKLKATDPALPFTTHIEAFSPSIPYNAADSALPCTIFHVTLENTSSSDTEAVFCFSWENIINVGGSMEVPNGGDRMFPTCYHTWNGSFVWSDRTKNYCEKKQRGEKETALLFAATDDRKNPMSFGEHLLWCSDPDAEAVCERSILPEDEPKFVEWLKQGKAPFEEGSESEFKAGAIVLRKGLKAGEKKEFDLILTWYMPVLLDETGKNPSVEYTNRFQNAWEVLEYVIKEKERLYVQTKEVEEILKKSTLPPWFVRRLLDDRFVTVTCSWYDKDGNFSINEAPTGMGGCLGTLDQRTASQAFYTTFYPELDKRELELFRLSQAEDGMCAHEIGFAGIKLVCRPFSQWPDLVAAYIIQVYHTYQRTADRAFLEKHMPHIKKAIEWTLTLDDKQCGIPYICAGRGTTYDNQFWEGINAFIATMQIASYRIGALCAQITGDAQSANRWRELAEIASNTRETYLWNETGKYYNNAYNMDMCEVDDSCFICSMAGEWAALRAGMEPVLTQKRIAEVTEAITKHCVGERGISDQGGRKDTTDGFLQYPMAYLISPALYAGNPESAWKVAETTERIITGPNSNHYNQSLTYSFNGERYGLPYYMTAPSTWNMLEALAGLRADLPERTLTLSPMREENQAYRMPVFLTKAWFEMEVSADGSKLTLQPIKSVDSCEFDTIRIYGTWKGDQEKTEYVNGYTVIHTDYDPGKDTMILKKS